MAVEKGTGKSAAVGEISTALSENVPTRLDIWTLSLVGGTVGEPYKV